MIKKNTKIIFEDESEQEKELEGGIPLSKGDIVQVYEKDSNKAANYEVINKKIEFFIKDKDQIANITYRLKKK